MLTGKSGIAGVFAAVPWCCVLPAGFALLGLTGAGVARVATADLLPVFLGLTAVFLGRAHYAMHVRQQGNRWSRRIVWISSFLAAAMWVPRLI